MRTQSGLLGSALAGLGIVLVAGCGGAGAGAGADDAAGVRASATAPATRVPAAVTADTRACAQVRAVLAHIAADTAGMLTTSPYDATISKRLSQQSVVLGQQGARAADPKIRTAAHDTAQAFSGVATAMRTKKKARLDRAVQKSRDAYRGLKSACSFGADG
ncbi:hypothetical protein [Marmoricola sp. RAF53]|uniref:hypothetical protein n=1 Tax=Marmoricola sp. RAF53 TaxID=3233059 RepID=UPI003F9A3DF6